MAHNNSNRLLLIATNTSLPPNNITLEIPLTDVSSLSSLAEQIKEMKEACNEELSLWVEEEKKGGGTDRKRGISDGDLSEGEEKDYPSLDADIDSILSAHTGSQADESKAKKIKN